MKCIFDNFSPAKTSRFFFFFKIFLSSSQFVVTMSMAFNNLVDSLDTKHMQMLVRERGNPTCLEQVVDELSKASIKLLLLYAAEWHERERADKQRADERADKQRADERADKQRADERADKQRADERADKQRADERADKQRADERADKQRADEQRQNARNHEFRMLQQQQQQQQPQGGMSLSHSELYDKVKPAEWVIEANQVEHRRRHYNAADEATVQNEMMQILENIARECGLNCDDTHDIVVHGLHKPDALITASTFHTVCPLDVALIVELKARTQLKRDKVPFFTFPNDHSGQVIDKLLRLRQVRTYGTLFGMLSNGYHYQLFKLYFNNSTDTCYKTKVYTLKDVGPLMSVLTTAAAEIKPLFWFVEELHKDKRFSGMSVRQLLGAGAHCRAWEFGNVKYESVAVVVAESKSGVRHLQRCVGVFRDLARKGERPKVLYEPLHLWCDEEDSRAVAVFPQVGTCWTREMFQAFELTRQDLIDVVDQIKHFHDNGYIHCDVAARNIVRYQDAGGDFHSVLIDAGTAVKAGEKWCGGTMSNAAVTWLQPNLPNINVAALTAYGVVTVPTKQEELWSFVFAVMDLCFSRPDVDLRSLVEFRKEQLKLPAVAAIGELVDKLDYRGVAKAVGDLVAIVPHGTKQWSSSKDKISPEHYRSGSPPSALHAARTARAAALDDRVPLRQGGSRTRGASSELLRQVRVDTGRGQRARRVRRQPPPHADVQKAVADSDRAKRGIPSRRRERRRRIDALTSPLRRCAPHSWRLRQDGALIGARGGIVDDQHHSRSGGAVRV
jgi:hypothetical protein